MTSTPSRRERHPTNNENNGSFSANSKLSQHASIRQRMKQQQGKKMFSSSISTADTSVENFFSPHSQQGEDTSRSFSPDSSVQDDEEYENGETSTPFLEEAQEPAADASLDHHSYWAMMEEYCRTNTTATPAHLDQKENVLVDTSLLSCCCTSPQQTCDSPDCASTINNNKTPSVWRQAQHEQQYDEEDDDHKNNTTLLLASPSVTPIRPLVVDPEASSLFRSTDSSTSSSLLMETPRGARGSFSALPDSSNDGDDEETTTSHDKEDDTNLYLQRIHQLEQALAAAQSTTSASQAKNHNQDPLWQRNQTLTKEVRFADQTCVELSGEKQVLQKEISLLQQQLKDAQEHQTTLQTDLLQAHKDRLETQAQYERLQQQQQEQQHEQQQQQHETVTQLEAALQNALVEAAAQADQCRTLQQQLHEAQLENQEVQAAAQQQADNYQVTMTSVVNKQQAELQQAQERIQELTRQQQQQVVQQQDTDAQDKHKATELALVTARVKVLDLERDLDEANTRAAGLEHDKKTLEEENEQAVALLRQENEKLLQWKELQKDYQVTQDDLEQQLQASQQEKDQLTNQLDAVQTKLVETERDLTETREQLEQATGTCERLQSDARVQDATVRRLVAAAATGIQVQSDALESQLDKKTQHLHERLTRLYTCVNYLQDSIVFDDDDVSEPPTPVRLGMSTSSSAAHAMNATFADSVNLQSTDLQNMEEARRLDNTPLRNNRSPSVGTLKSRLAASFLSPAVDDTVSSLGGSTSHFFADERALLETSVLSPDKQDDAVATLQKEMEATKQDLAACVADRDQLHQQLELSEQEKAEVQGTLQAKVLELSEAVRQNTELTLAVNEKTKELDALRDTVGQIKMGDDSSSRSPTVVSEDQEGQVLSALQVALKQCENNLASSEKQQRFLEAEAETLQRQLSTSGDRIKQLESDLELQTKFLSEKDKQLKITEDALVQSKTSYDKCKEDLLTVTQAKESCQIEIAALKRDCVEAKALNKQLQADLTDATQRISDAKSKAQYHESELELRRKKSVEIEDELKRAADALHASTLTLNDLKVEKESIETKLEETTSSLAKSMELSAHKTTECEFLARSVSQKEDELATLQSSLRESEVALTVMQASVNECNEKLVRFANKTQEQETEISNYKELLDAAENLTSNAEDRFLEVQSKLEQVLVYHNSVLSDKENLQSKLERCEKELRDLSTDQSKSRVTFEAKVTELKSKHEREIMTYKEDLQRTKEQLDANAQLINKLESIPKLAEVTNADLAALRSELETLQKSFKEKENQVGELENRKDIVEHRCKRLRDYVRKLTEKCDQWELFYDEQSQFLEKLKIANEKTRQNAGQLAHWYYQRDQLHSEERVLWTTERTNLQQVHNQLEKELDEIARELAAAVPRPVAR